MSERLGLIAGNGRFPILLAQGAREAGMEVIAVGFRGETSPELEKYVTRLHWVGIARIGRWIKALKKEGYTPGSGYGKFKASNIRIGHMGDVDVLSVKNYLAAIEAAAAKVRATAPAGASA